MSLFSADNRTAMIDYGLVVAFFLGASVILYSIYPKGFIEKQMQLESTNYALSAKYLTNLIKAYPEKAEYKLGQIDNLISLGKFDFALEIIKNVDMSNSKTYEMELFHLEFKALQKRYYSTNEAHFQAETLAKINVLLKKVILVDLDNVTELEFWYAKSLNFSLYEMASYFSLKLDEINGHNGSSRIDNLEIVNIFIFKGETEKARAFVENRKKHFGLWFNKLPTNYKTDADKEAVYEMKKKYYFRIIAAYGLLKDNENALKFARQYESTFYDDTNVSQKILKLYLALDSLPDAQRLAKQRLRRAFY